MPEISDQAVLILEHNVKKGYEKRYEQWLATIPTILQKAPGFVSRDVFPPSLPDRPYAGVDRIR